MADYFDFSSTDMNIVLILLDSSGSMSDDAQKVRLGLKYFRDKFMSFPEKNSIAISISQFNDLFYRGEFRKVTDLDISYSTGGGTALFYSIVRAEEYLNDYVREVIRLKKCEPKVTFLLFSDGHPEGDSLSEKDGKAAIKRMNIAKYTTVFVAFGGAIRSNFGDRLGFKATTNVDDREDLTSFFGEVLSESIKEQSQSYKGLGANFFSQTASQTSNSYSATTAQVLEDDAWMDDI